MKNLNIIPTEIDCVKWYGLIPNSARTLNPTLGKPFLRLVKQHFPKHHKLSKIFYKNTLKLSYCCMKNMSSIIKQHNVKTLSTDSNEKRSCNCRNKECCPLEGYYFKECMVDETKVLNYIMVHAKDSLNLVFITARNYFETEKMKRSFQSTFLNWKTNRKTTTYVGKYLCMQRPINVIQDVVIYA